MKSPCLVLLLIWSSFAFAADAPPPASQDTQAPPPASPPKRSAADLEKLVAPIALYSDPLLATILPASVYPLEIVQAARFVADTNNLAKLDAQPWDDNVKAVARVPGAIQKLNDDISWTIELGEAFLAQDKDVMDAIQSMRAKAQKVGTLQTTEQQIVTVTNVVVEKTVEEKVVVVTNTVVQIQPSSSSVVYVPTYTPAAVYYPPPAYVYNPVAPLVTFTAGVAMGAIIANNCDWGHGGCYHSDVDIDVDRNVNRNVNRNSNRSTASGQTGARASSTGTQKKWQPDQSRLSKSGAPSAATSARGAEARGWSSGGARASTQPGTGARSTPSAGSGARPSTGTAPASRPTASPSASRSSPSAGVSQSRSSSSGGSAFGGTSSGSGASSFSSRGASSRSSGGSSGGRSGGGGGRGGGGGGRR